MREPTVDPPPCILEYRFSTMPAPLQASPESQSAPGAVNVWVAPPTGTIVYCNQIIVAVPVGTGPNVFSAQSVAVTPNTTWWLVAGTTIGPGDEYGLPAGPQYQIVTLRAPADSHWNIDYELVLSIQTPAVSTVVDTFDLIFVETSAFDDPSKMIQRRGVRTLEKKAPELFLANLVAVSPSSAASTTPRTEFANAEALRLEWESNGSSFAVYAGSAASPVWTGADTSYTVEGGITADTTFTVAAAGLGSTATPRATITLTVTNPTLTPRSATAGTLTATSANVTHRAQLASASVGGFLTAARPAVLGAVTAPSATVTGAAQVSGALTSSDATAGALTANGTAALAQAGVTAVTVGSSGSFAPRSISPGTTYRASGDGVVVGNVGWGSSAGAKCSAQLVGFNSATGMCAANGGNSVVWHGKTESWMWGHPQSFAMPAPAGSTFVVNAYQMSSTAAPVSVAWVPLARNAQLDEAEAADELPVADAAEQQRPNVRREVDRVIDAVAALLGDRMSAPLRHRLTAAVVDVSTVAPEPVSH